MFDLIGDIHGYADALEALLKSMDYSITRGAYRHPERKVIFLGDYIDRGPKIRETLHMVRNMVEAGQAIALMGNHEHNAIGLNTQNQRTGEYLRPRIEKNLHQHAKTFVAFDHHKDEYQSFLNWFIGLPLFYEDENIRAVHACWDHDNINVLQKQLVQGRLSSDLIDRSFERSVFGDALNETIKGKEVKLPEGKVFRDVEQNVRTEIRYKWWVPTTNATYRNLSIEQDDHFPDETVDEQLLKTNRYYEPHEKPVFFGHYWLKGTPYLYRDNICCLDFSVANQGYLTCYRYHGEKTLDISSIKKVAANR